MSTKGQQQDLVEDSWEEIDEDRLTDRLSKLSNRDSSLPGGSEESSQSGSGGASNSALAAMLEEELRPRMILQRPQMQILRRPQPQAPEEKAAAESKPKAQIKSLDQRKQAYAEARLRILGSAHDEEEQQQKQVEQAPKKGSPNTNGYRINNNNATPNNNGGNIRLERPPNPFRPPPGNFHMQQQHPSQHPGPGPFYPPLPSGGRNHLPPEPTSSINHHYYQQQQQQQIGGPHVPGGYHFQHHQHHHHPQHPHQKQISPWNGMPSQSTGYHHAGLGGPMAAFGGPLGHNSSNNNVLRMPAGPDGSHGFTIRR